jgi:hypothetical protein
MPGWIDRYSEAFVTELEQFTDLDSVTVRHKIDRYFAFCPDNLGIIGIAMGCCT